MAKAGVSMDTKQHDNTLVHLAAKENNMTLLERLKDIGVDINAKNDEGNTPCCFQVSQVNVHFKIPDCSRCRCNLKTVLMKLYLIWPLKRIVTTTR